MNEPPSIIIVTNNVKIVNNTVNNVTNNFIVVPNKRRTVPVIYARPRPGLVQTMIEAVKALTRKKPPPGEEDELLRSV